MRMERYARLVGAYALAIFAIFLTVTPRPPPTLVADVCEGWVAGVGRRLDLFVVVHFCCFLYSSSVVGAPVAYLIGLVIEVLEHGARHVLPNFDECWYDTWLLDLLGANLAGCLLGGWLGRGRRGVRAPPGFAKLWCLCVVYAGLVFHDFCYGWYVFGGRFWRGVGAAVWLCKQPLQVALLREGLRGDAKTAARFTALTAAVLAVDAGAHAAWGTYGKLPDGLGAATVRVLAGETALAAGWAALGRLSARRAARTA
jgi:hypothetical protein